MLGLNCCLSRTHTNSSNTYVTAADRFLLFLTKRIKEDTKSTVARLIEPTLNHIFVDNISIGSKMLSTDVAFPKKH